MVGVDADAVLEDSIGGGINNGGVAVFGEEGLPVFGMVDDAGLTAFWLVSSEFADFPGTVTGTVPNDESGGVRDKGVGTDSVVFVPAGEVQFAVWPGVGVITYGGEIRFKL